jgi:hypothetical protein
MKRDKDTYHRTLLVQLLLLWVLHSKLLLLVVKALKLLLVKR